MNTKEWWSKEGGDAYTKRNKVDWQARIPFWKMILDKTGARSVFEFGCNAGWNLSAIRRIYPDVILQGLEINDKARWEAQRMGFKVCGHMGREYLSEGDLSEYLTGVSGIKFPKTAELVFTAGVLIHIPPEDLKQTMQALIDKSLDYVLAIEYYAEEATEVEYRREKELLWKRDYGRLYEDMGLELVGTSYPAQGFDDCCWWLFRK